MTLGTGYQNFCCPLEMISTVKLEGKLLFWKTLAMHARLKTSGPNVIKEFLSVISEFL